jgi:hypothetical protein
MSFEDRYQYWKGRLIELVRTQGFIPEPINPEYSWPLWTRKAFLNPHRGYRDRYTLFVFLLRNSNANIDVIQEYMMWWVNHGDLLNRYEKLSNTGHVQSMIRDWKSGDKFKRFHYLRKDWWNIIEHKEMKGITNANEGVDHTNIWTSGPPSAEEPSTLTTGPTHFELMDFTLPELPDTPPLGDFELGGVIPAAVRLADDRDEHDFEENPDDAALAAAYDEVRDSRFMRRKKLRRFAGYDADGNGIPFTKM